MELVSRAVEANPDADSRSIGKRAGLTKTISDTALQRLIREGFVKRHHVGAEWHYRSVRPYRASDRA
jgi:predicted transcriptional regulator